MFKYDPHQKSKNEIERTFINGRKYLEDILDELMPKNKKLSDQAIIITGQRGMGKSHFLMMLAFSIEKDELLRNHYLPVIFPEELFKAGSLYHLLKDSIERIFLLIDKDIVVSKAKIESLKAEFSQSCDIRFIGTKREQKEQRINVENHFFALFKKISTAIDRKFILLLENLQIIFGQKLSTDELKRLRGFLQENPETFLIIGSAVSIFERVGKYGEPFYNFFKFRRLTGLNKDEVKWFLETEGSIRKNPHIEDRLNKFRGEIEVFRILTGGNPRLILFLYDLLEESEDLIIDDILKKVTELTPYFKTETENLTPVKQMVLDTLCENAPAQTPSEIAEYLNEPIGIVIENLKRLLQEGRVRIVETERGKNIKKSETFYTVSDYFYRIWYQVRQSVFLNENLKWMAELASLLFTKPQLEEKIEPGIYANYLNIGFSYATLKKYNKAVENLKKYIHLIETPERLSLNVLKSIKSFAEKFYNEGKSIANLTNPKVSLEKRIESMQELLFLNQFNGIETIVASLFEKLEKTERGKWPQKELKELYFFLMSETILRLSNESKESNPEITARYFLRTAFLLNDKRPIEKKILGFLVNYISKTEKLKINKEGLLNIFTTWKEMNIFLPESVTALIGALENPKSRSAQVWSSDPLFKEVFMIMGGFSEDY